MLDGDWWWEVSWVDANRCRQERTRSAPPGGAAAAASVTANACQIALPTLPGSAVHTLPWTLATGCPDFVNSASGAEADTILYLLAYGILKNVGPNERYFSEGFESLRQALLAVNPHGQKKLGRLRTHEELLSC